MNAFINAVDRLNQYIGLSVAQLNGEVIWVQGTDPLIRIYWGNEDGTNLIASWDNEVNIGTMGVGTFYKAIAGLTPGTKYYYRCWASNDNGVSWATVSAARRCRSASRPTCSR